MVFASFLLDSKFAEKINAIVLFGSVARGDFDEESDIDIFVDTGYDIEGELKSALKLFEDSEEWKKWKLRGISNDISIKSGNMENWSLKRDVAGSGLLLYGKYKQMPEGMKYYMMIRASTAAFERKHKVKIWRKLYGYSQKVGSKKYVISGLIDTFGGKRLGRDIFIIPAEKRNEMVDFLTKNKIDYKVNEIWSDSIQPLATA